jgi:Dor1-like family
MKENLPILLDTLHSMKAQSKAVMEKRQLNTFMLENQNEISSVLQIPNAMSKAIREKSYEQAFQLKAQMGHLLTQFGTDVEIIKVTELMGGKLRTYRLSEAS